MTVNIRLHFVPGTYPEDVCESIALMLGTEPEQGKYTWHPAGDMKAEVKNYEGFGLQSCLELVGPAPEWSGGSQTFRFMWHWQVEANDGVDPGSPGMIPASTPLNVALAKRLVHIFGGWLNHEDMSAHDLFDEVVERPAELVEAWETRDSDTYWHVLRKRIRAMSAPLTEAEMSEARGYANYSGDDAMPTHHRVPKESDAEFLNNVADHLDGDGADRLREIAEKVS